MRKFFAPLLLITVVGFFLLRWFVQRSSPMPENLGVRADGRFTPCPDSPNCVSTFATDADHKMEPIPFTDSIHEAKAKMYNAIVDTPRTQIITNDPNYLHAEFRSRVWGFVDDVELYFDEEAGLIHFRSASRLGYGDGGVNRARMEALRAAFLK